MPVADSWKIRYPVDSAIQLSYSQPLFLSFVRNEPQPFTILQIVCTRQQLHHVLASKRTCSLNKINVFVLSETRDIVNASTLSSVCMHAIDSK